MDATRISRRLLDLAPRLMLMVRHESQAASAGNLGLAGFRALSKLNQHGPLTPGDLAGWLGVSRPAVSRLCEALERQGLVRRDSGDGDRRSHRLVLNPAGRRRVEKVKDDVVRRLAARLTTLAPARRRRLDKAFQVLEENLP